MALRRRTPRGERRQEIREWIGCHFCRDYGPTDCPGCGSGLIHLDHIIKPQETGTCPTSTTKT
jgi:hypothetical protein